MSKEAMKLALEALESYKGFIDDAHILEGQWRWIDGADNAQTALREALARPDFWEGYVPEPVKPRGEATLAQHEPEYWNVISPAGSIVASETDAIRGWARIAGSYKPTVESLLGFHDQGWRVLPKVAPPAQRTWEEWFKWWRTSKVADSTEAEIDFADFMLIVRAVEAEYGIKENP